MHVRIVEGVDYSFKNDFIIVGVTLKEFCRSVGPSGEQVKDDRKLGGCCRVSCTVLTHHHASIILLSFYYSFDSAATQQQLTWVLA